MDKKILKNYIYNILYQIVKIALPFILVKYTYAHVGASTLGISDTATTLSTWFILFGTLGVSTYGNREIAKVRDDKDKLSKTFWEILIMQVINMTVALVIYLIYITFVITDNKMIYYIICLSVFSSALDITWFYYGIENFKIVSIRNIVVKMVGVALIFMFVKTPADLWIYVLINSGTDFIGQAITYAGLKKYINNVKVSIKDAYKDHLLGTFILFVPTIAINVYTLLDQTILALYAVDPAQLTLYKTSINFDKNFLYFITSIGSVIMPRIANIIANGAKSEEVSKYINTTFKLALLLAIPMTVGIIGVVPQFFPWYTPSDYESLIGMCRLVSPVILLISLSNVFGIQYLVPTGKNSQYTKSIVAGAVVNLIVNLYAIPRWQGYGACIGSVCAEFTVTFVQWLYVRKDLKINATSTLIKVLIASALMYIPVTLTGNAMGPKLITNLLQAISGAITYVLVLIILKEQTLLNVINKFINRRGKNEEVA